ncbi:hypothetical protein DUNSADRAFT_10435 [Dunaliella salina]|uniref:Encoded protein n=1 Tax=Dunaliella salina TaxID=3046 RepID=A0ABQ7GFH2_DUNSA|nr:hypothetical protein DUNSADRAFT_10435 [Dunaliella salina]|eukprot:KAF5833314.1 hypothetical protein DUNSADRAFT_10435 [Dunaliella salina]
MKSGRRALARDACFALMCAGAGQDKGTPEACRILGHQQPGCSPGCQGQGPHVILLG